MGKETRKSHILRIVFFVVSTILIFYIILFIDGRRIYTLKIERELQRSIPSFVIYPFLSLSEKQCRFRHGDFRVKTSMWGGTPHSECVQIYKDGGSICYSNKDCLSHKCVLNNSDVDSLNNTDHQYLQLPESVRGLCSGDDMHVCENHEILISDTRTVYLILQCPIY